MVRLGLQLFSIRTFDEPFLTLLEIGANAGFAGIEYAYRVSDTDVSTTDIKTTLSELELESIGAHVSIEDLESELMPTVDFYRSIGCDTLVIPSLPAESFSSRTAIEETAARLTGLADRMDEANARLQYHNHSQEFERVDGLTALEQLLERTDDRVGIELDVGFALEQKIDPVEMIHLIDERLDLLHCTDYNPQRNEFVPLGEGALPVADIVEAFRSVGGSWIIYEYGQTESPESLETAARILSAHC